MKQQDGIATTRLLTKAAKVRSILPLKSAIHHPASAG
jgi:hypothetical protein